MDKWIVSTSRGANQYLTAERCNVTDRGDLRFTTDGINVAIFKHKHWLQAIRQTRPAPESSAT